jgi:hypothetical protein
MNSMGALSRRGGGGGAAHGIGRSAEGLRAQAARGVDEVLAGLALGR